LYVALMKAFKIPRIYHIHGKGVAGQLEQRWKRALYRWAFRDAWVIHLSPLACDAGPVIGTNRVLYVPNGVADRAVASVRDVQTASAAPLRILYLSNMIVQKGPLVLLEALARLHERGVPFQATFAGAPANDDCVNALAAGIAQSGLQDCVKYVGPAHGAAKEALFREHDVFAFPTYYAAETFPLVLLEAMQYQLPVVSTPEGGIPDIVRDGETGFLVPQRDAETLADRLATLADNPELRRTMGNRARNRYLDSFTLKHFEQNLTNALMHCLTSS
jgi:glycosyltransferase involved in cell wall biosynthesis